MNKLSVTRALAELKVLEKRISGAIGSLVLVDAFQNRSSVLMATKKNKQDFEGAEKPGLQSVNDMIDRHKKIKNAIVAANAVTMVKINGETMTVASAIEQKKSIAFKRELLKKMQSNWTSVKAGCDKLNTQVESNLQQLLESMFGSDKKTDPAIFEETAKSFRQQNEVKIFDPMGIEARIKELDEHITKFDGEVDFVLSESNAKTEIELA